MNWLSQDRLFDIKESGISQLVMKLFNVIRTRLVSRKEIKTALLGRFSFVFQIK